MCVLVNFKANKKDSTKLLIFPYQYINRLILFIIEIVIYCNICTVADKWQIFKFLCGALFSQVCPKCFSAKINWDHSRGALGTLY